LSSFSGVKVHIGLLLPRHVEKVDREPTVLYFLLTKRGPPSPSGDRSEFSGSGNMSRFMFAQPVSPLPERRGSNQSSLDLIPDLE